MPVQTLNPGAPARLQKAQYLNVDPVFGRMHPELSEIAEIAFRMMPVARDFELIGPKLAFRVDDGDKPPDGVELVRVETPNEESTAVHRAKGVGVAIPVVTPLMDPRQPPFCGDIEKLAGGIAAILASAIEDGVARMEADLGKQTYKHRTEVRIFVSVPSTVAAVDQTGMVLDETRPAMRGRLDIMFGK